MPFYPRLQFIIQLKSIYRPIELIAFKIMRE